MRTGAAIAIVAAVLAFAPAAIAEDAGPARPRTPEALSVPGHVSRWAFTLKTAIARRSPDVGSAAGARLRLGPQDGTDELVMVRRRVVAASGRRWVEVRLPILPNNSTGWVP